MTKMFTKPGCMDCENAICDECDSENPHRNNVIKFPVPTGEHLQGPAKCLRCKHEWQVVAPTGDVGDFECPSCGCYTGVITTLVEPAGLRWQCECENQLFFLDNKGPPMCASCGKRAHEWIDA